MNGSPMSWCPSVAAIALFFVSLLANAEVGQKPFPKIEGGSGNDPPRSAPPVDARQPVLTPPAGNPTGQACSTEVERTINLNEPELHNSFRKQVEGEVKHYLELPCNSPFPNYIEQQEQALRVERQKQDWGWGFNSRGVRVRTNSDEINAGRRQVGICAMRARSAQCSALTASVAPPPSNVSAGTNRPVPTSPVPPPNRSDNSAADEQQLTKQWRDALALARQRQADIDRLRVGKPRLHRGGSVAHHCLKPQPGGGMLNDCPYAVEYHYCVYRPKKDSWSEAFNCEKKGGAWQVGRGPGTPVLMHMGGEITYWFACRYGETLQKPDGISPADIEFQDGRGLLGRCAEWGSKRG